MGLLRHVQCVMVQHPSSKRSRWLLSGEGTRYEWLILIHTNAMTHDYLLNIV